MKKTMKGYGLIHAVLMAAALVLILISSSMAYALTNLTYVIITLAGAMVLDAVLALFLKRDTVLADLVMLATVALAALGLSQILVGRANLMGYVWFSDLESGNPTSVTALHLACCAMGSVVLGVILNVVAGFRKKKEA